MRLLRWLRQRTGRCPESWVIDGRRYWCEHRGGAHPVMHTALTHVGVAAWTS